jgi:hypothetical protein
MRIAMHGCFKDMGLRQPLRSAKLAGVTAARPRG